MTQPSDLTEPPEQRVPIKAVGADMATITPYQDGPLIVRGAFRLQDADGVEIDPGRGTVALCRCGKSALKPFCDGSHVRAGFRAGTRPSRARPSEILAQESLTNEMDKAETSRTDELVLGE